MRPIIKEDKPLRLTEEQIRQVLGSGLPVSLAYKDGKRKRIKSGRLTMAGGCGCGAWLEFERATQPSRVVHFPNAWSLILGRVKLRS